MLYRQEWSIPKVQPVRPSAFSIESLIMWLEQQPADERYDYHCIRGGCLIGKYCKSVGISFSLCHTAFHRRDDLSIAESSPWTFGAALDRARKALVA